MGKNENIIDAPDQNPEAGAFVYQGKGRGQRVYLGKQVATQIRYLNPILLRALLALAEVPMMLSVPGYYRPTGDGMPSADLDPDKMQLLTVQKRQVYDSWRKAATPRQVRICERVAQDEHSLWRIQKDFGLGWSKAVRELQLGLNHYCVAAGWGDQINPQNK
ncbi:hypothetical protein [Methylobacterium oryzae]|uniref:hypothetical protein n=1 Tax=Methylobacterium oryzae TaxID=334852 RepID=UPI002F35985E